jgi:putative redox protein
MIDSETQTPNEFPQTVSIREHRLTADVLPAEGGSDKGPSAHDLFDAALAACKTLTATWYAKRNGIPLERVSSHVERDDGDERKGTYRLRVKMEFHGPLDDAQKKKLHEVVQRCPVHKLMTTTTVEIETLPLE